MGAEARSKAEQRAAIQEQLQLLSSHVLEAAEADFGLKLQRVSVTVQVEDPHTPGGSVLASLYGAMAEGDEPADELLMLIKALEATAGRYDVSKEALVEVLMGEKLTFVRVPKAKAKTPRPGRPSRQMPRRRRHG